MIDPEDPYPCVGICTPDDDYRYCTGCGRPINSGAPTVETSVSISESPGEPAAESLPGRGFVTH